MRVCIENDSIMFKTVKFVLTASAVATLVACGGGGGGGTTAAPAAPVANAVAEGVWSGTSSSGYTLNTLILENGSSYVMFGNMVGTTLSVVGFDQGTASISGNSISGSLREYYGNGTSATGSMTGTVTTGTSITGSTVYGSTNTTFNLAPIASSTYVYGTPATLSSVSGNWTGNMLSGTSAAISINNGTGAIAGSNSGCNFTGTATPRASGKNVFDVSVTFGASPCALPGQTATGIALTYSIAGTALKQLLVAIQDSTKANGTMFFAQR